MATFGERIKELRKQRELTQRQMAAIFEVTERNYQDMNPPIVPVTKL